MDHTFVEGLGGRVLGQAQHLPVADAAEATGAHHEEEAQRPHAAQDVGVGPLATPGLGGGERVELEAAQQIVRQDAELLPGAVGAVVVGRHDIEGKLALELGSVFSWAPRPAMKSQSAPGPSALFVVTAEYSKWPSSGEKRLSWKFFRVSCWTRRR